MKEALLNILNEYLSLFPEEKQRQSAFLSFIQNHTEKEIADWNNFNGHMVCGGFIYSKTDRKFLVIYHKDLKMYLYPGGHFETHEKSPLDAAKREIEEETGLTNLKQIKSTQNEQVPLDIDTHIIEYDERLNLPSHYHYDFRYLFMVDRISEIKIDTDEASSYRWIDFDELEKESNYGIIVDKIKKILSKIK